MPIKMKGFAWLFSLIFLLAFGFISHGQNRSFLGALGGGEGVTQSFNYGNYTPAPPGYDVSKWWQGHSNYGGFSITNSSPRSGNSAYNASGGSTAGQVHGPLFPVAGGSTKKWVLQFYYQYNGGGGTNANARVDIGFNRATDNLGTGAEVSLVATGGSNVAVPYVKKVLQGTSQTNATYIALTATTINGGNNGNANVDDIAIYETDDGLVDNTAPDAPTNLMAQGYVCPDSTVNLSWTAPASGVDGGGYMVVRYTSSPSADDLPNVNGIYAVGNTIAFTNSGIVVYQGTNTSFSDLTANRNKTYYYRVFTFDKAYNYSSLIESSAITTGTNGNSSLTITPNSPSLMNANGVYEGFDITNLTASGGSSYVWSGGTSVNSAINSFKSSGTYTISMTTASGCIIQSSIQVLVRVIGLDKNGNVTEEQTIQVTPYGDINKKKRWIK